MLKRKSKKAGGPTHIGASLESILQGPLKAPQLSLEWKILGLWEQSVGTEISKHASPKAFKNGILFVDTSHAMWASELQLRSLKIRMKLNAAIGEEIVKEIHFRVGKVS